MKTYTNNTFMTMTKAELISHIRCLEHNLSAMHEMNDNQFNILMRKEADMHELIGAVTDGIESLDWYHLNMNGSLVHGSPSEHVAYVKYDEVVGVLKSLDLFGGD